MERKLITKPPDRLDQFATASGADRAGLRRGLRTRIGLSSLSLPDAAADACQAPFDASSQPGSNDSTILPQLIGIANLVLAYYDTIQVGNLAPDRPFRNKPADPISASPSMGRLAYAHLFHWRNTSWPWERIERCSGARCMQRPSTLGGPDGEEVPKPSMPGSPKCPMKGAWRAGFHMIRSSEAASMDVGGNRGEGQDLPGTSCCQRLASGETPGCDRVVDPRLENSSWNWLTRFDTTI